MSDLIVFLVYVQALLFAKARNFTRFRCDELIISCTGDGLIFGIRPWRPHNPLRSSEFTPPLFTSLQIPRCFVLLVCLYVCLFVGLSFLFFLFLVWLFRSLCGLFRNGELSWSEVTIEIHVCQSTDLQQRDVIVNPDRFRSLLAPLSLPLTC